MKECHGGNGLILGLDAVPKIEGIKESLPSFALGGVPETNSPPTPEDFGVDNRKLHVPSSERGANNAKIQTSRARSVTVKYPRTHKSVCRVGCTSR